MDEKKRILMVIEKTEEELESQAEAQVKPSISYPNQTNPIVKNLMQFNNSKIGDKLSISDLLR